MSATANYPTEPARYLDAYIAPLLPILTRSHFTPHQPPRRIVDSCVTSVVDIFVQLDRVEGKRRVSHIISNKGLLAL